MLGVAFDAVCAMIIAFKAAVPQGPWPLVLALLMQSDAGDDLSSMSQAGNGAVQALALDQLRVRGR